MELAVAEIGGSLTGGRSLPSGSRLARRAGAGAGLGEGQVPQPDATSGAGARHLGRPDGCGPQSDRSLANGVLDRRLVVEHGRSSKLAVGVRRDSVVRVLGMGDGEAAAGARLGTRAQGGETATGVHELGE